MSLLYFFETTLEYHGVTSKELYKLWLKHAGPAFKLHEQGLMKYAFKVSVKLQNGVVDSYLHQYQFVQDSLNNN